MNSTEIIPLPGTEGATQPFWSPDSESVGFVVRSGEQYRLLRIDRDGRGVTTICEEGRGRGTWGKDGADSVWLAEGLWSVPEKGGVPTLVTKVRRRRVKPVTSGRCFLPTVAVSSTWRRHQTTLNRDKNVDQAGLARRQHDAATF